MFTNEIYVNLRSLSVSTHVCKDDIRPLSVVPAPSKASPFAFWSSSMRYYASFNHPRKMDTVRQRSSGLTVELCLWVLSLEILQSGCTGTGSGYRCKSVKARSTTCKHLFWRYDALEDLNSGLFKALLKV